MYISKAILKPVRGKAEFSLEVPGRAREEVCFVAIADCSTQGLRQGDVRLAAAADQPLSWGDWLAHNVLSAHQSGKIAPIFGLGAIGPPGLHRALS
eukprot:SAG25_NODE_93_length_16012_cov_22.660341_5_plen_96_part_00